MLKVSFGFLTYGLLLSVSLGYGISKKFPDCGVGEHCTNLVNCEPLMYFLESEEMRTSNYKQEILQDRQCGNAKYCCPNRGHQEFYKQCISLDKCLQLSGQKMTIDILKSSINRICRIDFLEEYLRKRVYVYCEREEFAECESNEICARIGSCPTLELIKKPPRYEMANKRLMRRQCAENSYCCPKQGTNSTTKQYYQTVVSVCHPNQRCIPWIKCHKNVKLSLPNSKPHSPDNRWCNIDTSETRLEKRFYTCCLEPGNVLPSSCGPVPSPFENKFDRVVRPNAYPWMAMLIYEKRKRKGPYANSVSKCAGSLINTRYVLTAAHCVTRGESISQGLVLRRVRLGEHDTHKNPDCDHGPPCSAPYVEIDVEYFKVHEAYANTSRFESDIALVRLKVPVRYTKEIQPICLLKDPINLRNMPLLIAGWGQTEVEANSSVLRYATVFEGLKYCKDTSFYRPETQICAGSRYGDNACDGDSGGPMMVSLHHGGEKSMYVAGIISYGYKCDGDTGTFYTVTGTFFKWIKAKLEP